MSSQSLILIVDDELTSRRILDQILTEKGFRTALASGGREALYLAEKLLPDLILLDVIMPEIDGYEVCRRIRADKYLAEVPIVMVTALEDKKSLIKGIEAGADDFVSKTYDVDELITRVRSITRLNRYRRLVSERARLEWVLENTDDGFLLLNDADEIIYANPKARLYLGMSTESSAENREKFLDLVKKEYLFEPEDAWKDWSDCYAEEPACDKFLVRPESPTSNACWLHVGIWKNFASGEFQKMIRLRDVTSRVSTVRDTRTFHSTISHKLRTPLYAMQVSLEMLADPHMDLERNETLELAEEALKGIKRLSGEIEDILQFLEAPCVATGGKGFVVRELDELAQTVCSDLELTKPFIKIPEELRNKNVKLPIRAMEWILRELFENSRKFHPAASPRIELRTSEIEDDRLVLRIMDDGVTLSPKQLADVWKPYYQGEKFFTGETAGMGLGLTMVASLVRQIGGACMLYNRKDGSGVCVELILPFE